MDEGVWSGGGGGQGRCVGKSQVLVKIQKKWGGGGFGQGVGQGGRVGGQGGCEQELIFNFFLGGGGGGSGGGGVREDVNEEVL